MKNIRDLFNFNKTLFLLTTAAVMTFTGCEKIFDDEDDKPKEKEKTEVHIGGDKAPGFSTLWLGYHQDKQGAPLTIEPIFNVSQSGYNVTTIQGYITNNPDSVDAEIKVSIIYMKEQLEQLYMMKKYGGLAYVNVKITANEGKYLAEVENTDYVLKSLEFQTQPLTCIYAPELAVANVETSYNSGIERIKYQGDDNIYTMDEINRDHKIHKIVETINFARTYADDYTAGYIVGNTATEITAPSDKLNPLVKDLCETADGIFVEMTIKDYNVTKCSGLYNGNHFKLPGRYYIWENIPK